jgi:hypothetical protein
LEERNYSSYSLLTSALDGVSGQRHVPAALNPPRKVLPVPIEQEALWAPEPVWTQRLEEKSYFATAGDRTFIARSPSSWSDTILTKLPRLQSHELDAKILILTKSHRFKLFHY